MEKFDNAVLGRPQTTEQAIAMLKLLYPDLAGEKFTLPPMQGMRSITVFTYREAIKLNPHQGLDTQFQNEAYALFKASSAGINSMRVPGIISFDRDHSIIRMHRMSGEPLVSDIGGEQKALAALPSDEKTAIGETIGAFLAELHAISLKGCDTAMLPVTGFMDWPVTVLHDYAEINPNLSADEVRRLTNAVEFMRRFREPDKVSLLHMDVNATNILRDEKGRYSMIDFGTAFASAPYLDFIRPIYLFPREIWQTALDYYESEAGALDRDMLQGALDYYYFVRQIGGVRRGGVPKADIQPVSLDPAP